MTSDEIWDRISKIKRDVATTRLDINWSNFNKERKSNMPPRKDYSGYFATANEKPAPRSLADKVKMFFDGPSVQIDHVIFNGPATIIFWADDTKTVVKCMEDEEFDPEKGVAMAICKRLYGDDFHRVFKDAIKNAKGQPGI